MPHHSLFEDAWIDSYVFNLFQDTTWLFYSCQQFVAMQYLTATLSLRPSATFTRMPQPSPTYGFRMVD